MSGFGVAADAQSNLYFVTGNSNLGAQTYDSVTNPANSVLKVNYGLTNVLDYFTPSNHNALDAKDMDFGSGGVTLLPDQPGLNPFLAVTAGKDGALYLNDRTSLTVPLDYVSIGSCFCGQSYFHASGAGHIVSSGGANVIVWQVVTSPPASSVFPAYLNQEDLGPVQQKGGDGGFFTSISSKGETNMIIWAVPRPDPTQSTQVSLYAFEAKQVSQRTTLSNPPILKVSAGVWTNASTNANIVPVVSNGRVFVAGSKTLNIFATIP